ncbi:unnamed protein product [Owenia fusiformis]|uniref:Uncharacterized protein n=1 Tax=Owenia fusiformis TaxID=6347 RepID=A0A8J1XG79_OWEFU|nr:unnamed protein product [Owenia fusiformis]
MDSVIVLLATVAFAVCYVQDEVILEPEKSVEKREHGKWNYCKYGNDWTENPRYLDGKKVRWKVWRCRYSEDKRTCDRFRCKHNVLRQWQHNEYNALGQFLHTKRYFKYTNDCIKYNNVPFWCGVSDKWVSEG